MTENIHVDNVFCFCVCVNYCNYFKNTTFLDKISPNVLKKLHVSSLCHNCTGMVSGPNKVIHNTVDVPHLLNINRIIDVQRLNNARQNM